MARRGETGLTSAQRYAFFRALGVACMGLGISTSDGREAYRKTVMREEAGVEHLAQMSRTEDFDAVMKRFAADAGDYQTACRFAAGNEARKAELVRACCEQVLQLKGCVAGTTEAADYLAGIVEQARIPCGRSLIDSSFWVDVSPDSLLTLFQILDTHRRRLLRQLLAGRPERAVMGFDRDLVYMPLPTGGVRIAYGPRAADPSDKIQINIRRSRE